MNQRVFKKVSTPFENFKPTSAILMINAVDSQINTLKVFIEAIEDSKLKHLIVVNKMDLVQGGIEELESRLGVTTLPLSLNRYEASTSKARLPNQRYLSVGLLNRITYTEFDALRKMLPGVVNDLGTDSLYDVANGSEPQRNLEIVQSWDALRYINTMVKSDDQIVSLNKCKELIVNGQKLYDAVPISLEPKSNGDHLESLLEALSVFKKLAEINSVAD